MGKEVKEMFTSLEIINESVLRNLDGVGCKNADAQLDYLAMLLRLAKGNGCKRTAECVVIVMENIMGAMVNKEWGLNLL